MKAPIRKMKKLRGIVAREKAGQQPTKAERKFVEKRGKQ